MKQKAAAKAAALSTQLDAARADATSKPDPPPPRTRPRRPRPERPTPPGGERGQARARAGLGLHQPARRRSFMYGATRTSRGRTGRGVRRDIEVPVTIRGSRQADRNARVHGDGARRQGSALERGHDRQRGTTPRTRSTASPSRRICSIASRRPRCRDLDHRLGRAAEAVETNYRNRNSFAGG